jgi:hypothetical protein
MTVYHFKINNLVLILFALFTLCAFKVSSQDFKGEFISFKTSYKDEIEQSNNFVENSQFNIAIQIESNKGYVAIQDPRIPDKPLIYKIFQNESSAETDRLQIYVFQAQREDIATSAYSQLTIYIKESEINLMIIDSRSSQVFHNLKINQ